MEYKLTPTDRIIALRIVAIYAFFSALWIYLSDTLLGLLFSDPAVIVRYSVFKGLVFISVTVALLYYLISRYIRQSREAEEALKSLNEVLEERVAQRTAELERQNRELQETYRGLQAETAGRIQAVQELRVKDQMMMQQNRHAAMGEMLSNIAHHWRQPLNVLGLNIQEIGFCFERGSCNKELLETNIGNVMQILRTLSQTIDDFRDFSAIDQERHEFSVVQAVASTISLVEESFRQRGIAIESSSSGDPSVNGYPNEYRQVLLNILINSRDAFGDKPPADARIRVHAGEEGGRSVVTVTDNAGGIKQESLERIFDAFYTTKEHGQGTGVALFMAKNIIEKKMGGRLTARNAGGGAVFRIEV